MEAPDTSAAVVLLTRVTEARAAAAAVMTRLGGSTSACALARDGRSFPAYKYHEGRAAALGSLARRLRRTTGDPATLVAELTEEWRREVDRRRDQGRDWAAYAAGGLDAAETAGSWLSEADPRPRS